MPAPKFPKTVLVTEELDNDNTKYLLVHKDVNDLPHDAEFVGMYTLTGWAVVKRTVQLQLPKGAK